MVKSTKPSFPWDHIKAESMRNLCRDLGLKQPHTTRSTMIDFLESVWKVGLPKALDNASAAMPTSTSLSAPRTSQKRMRDTPTTVTTASSVSNGDDSSPSKRHRRGPDVTSDYNTRHKADRRGRLSDPGPIKRRRGRPPANGTAIPSTVVDQPVRTSKKRRLSPVVAVTRSAGRAGKQTPAASRSSRRITLGEPFTSDTTQDGDEEEEAETSISTVVTKRRRVVDPVITTPRTRKQKEKEEDATTSVAASRGRRVSKPTPKKAVMNGVTHMRMDDDYRPEQDEEEGDYEDEDEEEENQIPIRQLPRRSLPARLPRRFQPRRQRPSASPSKPRPAPRKPRTSNRTARMGVGGASRGRGRPRRRPRANSVKFVFDGVDVPPVNVAWKKKNSNDETVIGYHDEDADGEIDEEVHPPVVGIPKEREEEARTEEQEGEEGQEPTEAGEPEEEQEQVEEKAEAGEPPVEEQGDASGQEEAGEATQPEEEEDEGEQVEAGDVAEEQQQGDVDDEETMDQGEDDLVVGGLIPDDTSSLGNSNKENEAPEGQVEETVMTDDAAAAEMAAQTVLFGAPITVTTTTMVEYIGEDDGVEIMEDVHGMEGIGGMEDIENMDDEMQGPTVEDINSFIA